MSSLLSFHLHLGIVQSQENDAEFINCKIVPRVPNFAFRDVSALGVAVLFNTTDNIDIFLNSGCDVNYNGTYREAEETRCENPDLFASLGIPCRRTVRFEGYTPLNLAAINRNVEAVRRLLQVRGVDVNKASTLPSSPITNAVYSGSLEMVRLLVDAGASLDTREGKDKISLLMVALNSDSLPMVKYLISKGVDVNAVDNRGYTAVAFAAEKEDPSYITALADAGADLNRPQSSSQESPLGVSVRNNRTQIVKFLLSRRVNLEAVDAEGRTPLFWAAFSGRIDILTQLVEAGADVNARDNKEGSNPLIYAIVSGNQEAVTYLVRNGADVDARETSGLSSSYYAASV